MLQLKRSSAGGEAAGGGEAAAAAVAVVDGETVILTELFELVDAFVLPSTVRWSQFDHEHPTLRP